MTWQHLQHLEKQAAIKTIFPQGKYVFLYREDVVAQAISLYLATQSGFFNSSLAGNKQHLPEYNGATILYWVKRILKQEEKLQDFCEEQSITPLRIRYEDMQSNLKGVLTDIADHVAEALPASVQEELSSNGTQKIATGINKEFADRLLVDYGKEIKKLLEKRVT